MLSTVNVDALSVISDRQAVPKALKTLRDECEEATVKFASLAITPADLTASAGTQTLPFAAALPANALVIGSGLDVTAIFDNAGDSASCTADIGINGGDTDAFVDGASLDGIAKVGSPAGAGMGTLVGAITPCVVVAADVDVDTLTKGAATAWVAYVEVG